MAGLNATHQTSLRAVLWLVKEDVSLLKDPDVRFRNSRNLGGTKLMLATNLGGLVTGCIEADFCKYSHVGILRVWI